MQRKTSKRTESPERSVIDPARALPDNRPLLKLGINADPWAALDAIMATEPEPMGPEWFTVREFAQRYKMSTRNAQQKLGAMYDAGQLNRWRGRRQGQPGSGFRKYSAKPQ